MKRLLIIAVMLAVIAVGANLAMAAELRDLDKEGNGFIIEATATGFTVTVIDRFTKLSAPFTGPDASSWIQEKGGVSLISTAGWVVDGKKGNAKSASYDVKAGEGKAVYVFAVNPSVVGKPVNVAVSNGSVNDQRSIWLCPPWTSQVFFARANNAHPDGEHMIFFQLEGEIVRSVVDEAKKGGWIPAAVYHAAKMK